MATSLTILPPAPLQSSSLSLHTLLPTNARRPKLSLNTAQTSQTRSVGKAASLRLDTLSAVSPTVRNTFSNAYETPAPAQGRPSLRLSTSDDSTATRQDSSDRSTPSTYDSASSSSSASSTDSIATPPPYKLSHSIPSILTNSPYLSIRSRKMSRPFFPPVKKVSFREPLVEEITNSKYTARHSDLSASSSSESSESTTDASTSTSTSSKSTFTESEGASFSKLNLKVSPPPSTEASSPTSSVCSNDSKHSITGKRDSAEAEGEDSCPETPIAGRRKRQRDWKWTLGPVNRDSSSSSVSSEMTTSDDDSS